MMGAHDCSNWTPSRPGYMVCVECGAERTEPDAIHTYFSLSYANYLVLHRTRLQSMPENWQAQFVALLAELDNALELPEGAADQSYSVHVREPSGRFGVELIPHYNRGRTRLERVR